MLTFSRLTPLRNLAVIATRTMSSQPPHIPPPILNCLASSSTGTSFPSLNFIPSEPPYHPLQDPKLSNLSGPLLDILETASNHLHASRLVTFPTETVYGLGANTLDSEAVKKVYALKGRPSDNPLIVHVSSLSMLYRLTPPSYQLSSLYLALISNFWPGPLTILVPSLNPPPLPAPQTTAIRLPSHPLARALITISNTPISAPSANSSGRPSPTLAEHVYRDLAQKVTLPDGKPNPLGCILDGGPCDVGVESTVVDATGWMEGRGGIVKVLRPGGVGVEDIERVVKEVEDRLEMHENTKVWVYGRDRDLDPVDSSSTSKSQPPRQIKETSPQIHNPSTPGMKYKHYSPSVPVYLLYPSTTFPNPDHQDEGLPQDVSIRNSDGQLWTSRTVLEEIMKQQKGNGMDEMGEERSRRKFGLMHFKSSPLTRDIKRTPLSTRSPVIETTSSDANGLNKAGLKTTLVDIKGLSMGKEPEDAARALFSGMLALENKRSSQPDPSDQNPSSSHHSTSSILGTERDSEEKKGVDAILIEACLSKGMGLAVMERAGKAVGGGGSNAGLARGDSGDEPVIKRFWVKVQDDESTEAKVVGPSDSSTVPTPGPGPAPSTSSLSVTKTYRPYFTAREIEVLTEKQRGKLSMTRVEKGRQTACGFIDAVGKRLGFPRRTIATAQTLYHRFHLFFPLRDFNYTEVTLSTLYVSSKLHDTLKKPRDIILASYAIRFPDLLRGRTQIDPATVDQKMLEQDKRRVVAVERLILETVSFNLEARGEVWQWAVKIGKAMGISKEFNEQAYRLLTDVHRTLAPLESPPQALILASILSTALFSLPPATDTLSSLKQEASIVKRHFEENRTWEEVFSTSIAEVYSVTHHLIDLYVTILTVPTSDPSLPTSSFSPASPGELLSGLSSTSNPPATPNGGSSSSANQVLPTAFNLLPYWTPSTLTQLKISLLENKTDTDSSAQSHPGNDSAKDQEVRQMILDGQRGRDIAKGRNSAEIWGGLADGMGKNNSTIRFFFS